MITEQNPRPKRRPRYKGKHPRLAEHKYKELNSEKYSSEIAKIEARGATVLGTHRPILTKEILEILDPKPHEIGLDATLGFGGHSTLLLERLTGGGKLIALDQDPIERVKTEARLRERGFDSNRLIIGGINFCDARKFLEQNNFSKVDFILADLGVSSMQIDDPQRGFSFKIDSDLDLRMNPQSGRPAKDWIEVLDVQKLSEILRDNSDEIFASQIAKEVIAARPKTTLELANAVRKVMAGFSPRRKEEQGDSPIRRTFQALRILVNDEFKVLDQFLSDIPKILAPGGRVAIMSFHSGEDRRVKKSFQAEHRRGVFSAISDEVIRPSFDEQRANSRSKSAKLRWARATTS